MAIPIEVKRKVREEQAVVNLTQRLHRQIHEAIRSVYTLTNPKTKLSKLKLAICNIDKIEKIAYQNKFILISSVALSDQDILGSKQLASNYVFFNIYDLEQLEITINALWDDAKQEIQNQSLEKQLAKKKIKDKLTQQKQLERQKIADIRAKEKAHIAAEKLKEKQAKKEIKDKIARQKELERQKRADIRAKEKARIAAEKTKARQARQELRDELAQQKEMQRRIRINDRIKEKASLAAEKAAIKLAEKERKSQLRLSLDKASIKAKRAETVAVSTMLKNIFVDNEGVATQTTTTHVDPTFGAIGSLDPETIALMRIMASKQLWPREELEQLAAEKNLMLDGALDSINDASYDHFGGPFFEGDDPIEINLEFARRLPHDHNRNPSERP